MTRLFLNCILVATLAATAGLAVKPSAAADVRVFTSGAPADIQRGLARDFSEKSGHRLVITSGTLGAIQPREAWKVGGFEPLDGKR